MKFARLAVALAVAFPALALADPQYRITDLGLTAGNTSSLGYDISANGLYAVGRDYGGSADVGPAFIWSASTGIQALGNLSGRNYGTANGVNDAGIAVGVSALNVNGGSPVPVMWSSTGQATQLSMPGGQTVGRAFDINAGGIAVGSVGSGNSELATIFDTKTNTSKLVTAMTDTGTYMQTALSISRNGIVAGVGVDPGSLNVAVVYNSNTGVLTQLQMPAYTGGSFNSSLGYEISDNGKYVVGTSGQSTQPWIWSADTGAVLLAPLPSDGSLGILRGVNDQGWAVGTFSGLYANPGLYADGHTYRLGDILVNGDGWNLQATTSASAQSIGNDGSIIGWGLYNGATHAFVMTPVPEPASYALMAAGLFALGAVARRRKIVAQADRS